MKIYVATGWDNRGRAQEIMNTLALHGHEITFNWTCSAEADANQAIQDYMGVLSADAFVLIAEHEGMMGAWVEMGIACARNIPVYILGDKGDRCIFLQLPNIHRGIDPLLN